MGRLLSRWGVAAVLALVANALVPVASSEGAAPRDGRIVASDIDTGQLQTMNPDGAARRTISPSGSNAFEPAWSPDGTHIVYTSDLAGDPRIFTIRADGSGRQQVTSDPVGFVHDTPAYTPDGQRILYTRCRPDPPGGCSIYSVRTNGKDRHAVTAYGTGDKADFYPDVSPDGARVAFARLGANGILAQVWVARIDGSHAHAITAPALEAATPSWTPDGHHLLVTSDWAHVGDNIYRVRDDGQHVTKLTSTRFPHNSVEPSASPSGSRIVYSDDQAYPQVIGADLFVMNADGSGKHAIATRTRLLGADWGTAPLITPSSTSSRSTAPESTTRRPLPVPGSLTGRYGHTPSLSSKWSR